MDQQIKKAQELACGGEFQKAYELLEGIDRDSEAACLFVSVCRMLEKTSLAERELCAILSKDPGHPRANHLKAMELLEGANLDEAEICLKKAEQGYSQNQNQELSELYTDWGNLHLKRGDTVKAILSWRRALKAAPQNDIALHNLEQFEDPRFENAGTVNEMIKMAKHPSQVLAHLMRSQDFKTPQEAEDFADYILSLWNTTPR